MKNLKAKSTRLRNALQKHDPKSVVQSATERGLIPGSDVGVTNQCITDVYFCLDVVRFLARAGVPIESDAVSALSEGIDQARKEWEKCSEGANRWTQFRASSLAVRRSFDRVFIDSVGWIVNDANASLEQLWEVHVQAEEVKGALARTTSSIIKGNEELKSGLVGFRQLQKRSTAAAKKIEVRLADAQALLKSITEIRTDARADRAAIGDLLAEARVHQKALEQLGALVERYRTDIERLTAEYLKRQEEQGKEHRRVLESLGETAKKADAILVHATAASLFKSFNRRRKDLAREAKRMGGFLVLGLCIAAFAAFFATAYVYQSPEDLTRLITVKLIIGAPIVFAVWFCAARYRSLKQQEAEYAFKSDMAVSFEPFKRLVADMTGQFPEEYKLRAYDLVDHMIRQVFEEPPSVARARPELAAKRSRTKSSKREANDSDALTELIGLLRDLLKKPGATL